MTGPRQVLTRVAEDYLKAIWSAEEWGAPPISAKQLAARFAITPATVSVTLKRLAGQGLLDHPAYGPITLTAEGRRHALAVVRRHRLLETFLVEVLHYDWAEVHEEAEELEHAVSDRLIDRIAAALGEPAADPHGDPIPTSDGVVRRPAVVRRLWGAPPGRYRVARVFDGDVDTLRRCAAAGVVPDRILDVTTQDDGVVTVLTEHGLAEVPEREAASVLLEPLTR